MTKLYVAFRKFTNTAKNRRTKKSYIEKFSLNLSRLGILQCDV
jgi:hypothetical protein